MDSAEAAELIADPGTMPLGGPNPLESEVHGPFGLESTAPAIQPLSETEDAADQNITRLLQKVAAPSLAELERMINELQQARAYLASEGERIEREAERYVQLSQTTLGSVKVISDAVCEWRKAGHPV
jgi:hypothetical protein